MPKRILVVDDNEDTLFGLKEVLESPTVRVCTAETREGAVSLLNRTAYDVVIADLMLSGASPEEGIALVLYVTANYEKTKTIVITGCGESDIMDRSYEAGASLFFLKPVPAKVLQKALSTFWTI